MGIGNGLVLSNRTVKRHFNTDKVIEEKVAQRLAPDYWNWVYRGAVTTPKDQVKILLNFFIIIFSIRQNVNFVPFLLPLLLLKVVSTIRLVTTSFLTCQSSI